MVRWPHSRLATEARADKLECGLFGALLASTVLAFMFWLGIELSMLTLIFP
jgi:hypothetical protein